jgi:hypothetical protein
MKKAILASAFLLAFTMTAFGQEIVRYAGNSKRDEIGQALITAAQRQGYRLADYAASQQVFGLATDQQVIFLRPIDGFGERLQFNMWVSWNYVRSHGQGESAQFLLFGVRDGMIKGQAGFIMETTRGLVYQWRTHADKQRTSLDSVLNTTILMLENASKATESASVTLPDFVPYVHFPSEKALNLIPQPPKAKCARFWECEP